MERFTGWLCRKCWKVNPRKVVFVNHMGRGYRCNPKYVAEALLASGANLELVWMGPLGEDRLPNGISHSSLHGLGAIRHLATAAAIVDNMSLKRFLEKGFVKKQGQTYIQTWHGSMGIKRIGSSLAHIADEMKLIDYLVSNSDFETQVYRENWTGTYAIKEFGHPRNDIFFCDASAAKGKVSSRYSLAAGTKTILYAPTFRDDGRAFSGGFDCAALLAALAKRFRGEWAILFRAHPKTKKERLSTLDEDTRRHVVDVSSYDDIQELMAFADAMITDYSSCIYDFVLTGRPGFIYAPDLKDYDESRGFYYPLSETPFPVAQDMAGLASCIETFDDVSYPEKVARFLKARGCKERGCASRLTAQLVLDSIKATKEGKFAT